jgi:hypothetical protein
VTSDQFAGVAADEIEDAHLGGIVRQWSTFRGSPPPAQVQDRGHRRAG